MLNADGWPHDVSLDAYETFVPPAAIEGGTPVDAGNDDVERTDDPIDGPAAAASGNVSGENEGEVEGEVDGEIDGEVEENGNVELTAAEVEELLEAAEAAESNDDALLEYFSKGQAKVLNRMAEEKANAAVEAQPQQSFQIQINEREPRQVEGHKSRYFDEVVVLAEQRKNIALVGPTGCGKTHLCAQVAEALDLPFYSVSCSEGMSESQLTGWLLPVGDDGKFTYVPATFVTAFENGGVFLLDEGDAMDPNVGLVINTAAANGHMHVPQRHGNEFVQKHKDFVLIMAMNTFGQGADARFVWAQRARRCNAGSLQGGFDPYGLRP